MKKLPYSYKIPPKFKLLVLIEYETFTQGFCTVRTIKKKFDIGKEYLQAVLREMNDLNLILNIHNPLSNLEKRYIISDFGKLHLSNELKYMR